jgi:hypothetical protein
MYGKQAGREEESFLSNFFFGLFSSAAAVKFSQAATFCRPNGKGLPFFVEK